MIELPSATKHLLAQYLEKVRQDHEHYLSSSDRLEIYKTFGTSKIENYSFPVDVDAFFREISFAEYAINWLAIVTAEHVLPLWDVAIPNVFGKERRETDAFPGDILQAARDVLEHKIEIKKAAEDYHEINYYSSSNFERFIPYNIYCVYAAAESALLQILFGEQIFHGTQLDRKGLVSTRELSRVNDFAASAEAACSLTDTKAPGEWIAFFRGVKPVSGFETDLKKALNFWEWWLTEAIPQAWELANKTFPGKE